MQTLQDLTAGNNSSNSSITGQDGSSSNASDLYSEGAQFCTSARKPNILTDAFPGFLSLQANYTKAPRIWPQPIPSASFPIHYHPNI
jgi:hypothetical protein